MPEEITSAEALLELAGRDTLNAIPVLILLHAIDELFPRENSRLWKHLTRSPYESLWIDFEAMRSDFGFSGSNAALIDLAHDLWNGDVRSSMNDVMCRTDLRRRRLVVEALKAKLEGGSGPVSRNAVERLRNMKKGGQEGIE